jgi:putative ABC transport system permease protein
MHFIGEWRRRLWYLLNRRRFEDALKLEMEAHRAMLDDPKRFGNTLRLREASGDVWGWAWLDAFARDIRFAARALRRTPGFTVVTILSLALGLAFAASTAAVVNAYLIRSLPYPAADRLFHVRYAPPGPWEPRGMSALDWQSVDDVVEFAVASAGETFYLTGGGYAQPARGLRASPGFLEGLGVRAVVGRSLTRNDFSAAGEPVVLIGHSLWRDRFGSDPGIVGRILHAETESQTGPAESWRIVGVLPPDFYYGRDSRDKVDILVPLPARVRTYMVRLRPGIPVAAAERRITEAARSVASGLPPDWTGVHLESVRARYLAQVRPILMSVTFAVGLVLVIVCANVAVLMLLRTLRRQKEVALRIALGSARRHIGRMLAAETALVCTGALALGLAMTNLALGLLAPLVETHLGRSAPGGTAAIAVDWTVALVVGGLAALIALSLAFLPLLTPWQRRLADTLRGDDRSGADGPTMRRLRGSLIALEVAGSLVLLVSCGLMIRNVVGMLRTDLGFATDGLVRARIVLSARNYPDAAAFRRFYEQFSVRLSALAGSPVVFTNWPPFFETPKQFVETMSSGEGGVTAGVMMVSANYFPTLGVEVRQGRGFRAGDAAAAEPAAVVSETLARRLWPEGRAVGQRLRSVEQTPGGSTAGAWRTVIGVAADVRQTYGDTDLHDLYLPFVPDGRFGSFFLRTDRPASSLVPALREVVAGIDPRAVIHEPHSVESENGQLAGARFLTSMLTGFAAMAAFLAILGIYGVTAYAAQQRERELAIRVALGATRRAVLVLFLKDGGLVLVAGIVAGLVSAYPVARVLRNQLEGVRSVDALTVAGTCALLFSAGIAAIWWPARRASARSPMVVLKAG